MIDLSKLPNFKPDPEKLMLSEELCWICKNRQKCPAQWECATIANMDNDDTSKGVDKA